MERIYLSGACRTPIGKVGGILSGKSATELGAIVIAEAVKRVGLNPKMVEHVFMGCVIQAGLGQNVARQAAIKAGLPVTTTAETINTVCGSSLDCVNLAANMIRCGDADIVIAGGTESMSNAPFAMMQARFGYYMGFPTKHSELVDTMVNDALWDAFNNVHMGITAENIAKRWKLTREEMDRFAFASYQKTGLAIESGAFREEIVPVAVKQKNQTMFIDTDERTHLGITIESLAKLKPVFDPEGTVTAGNSTGINDGAAAIVLISEKKCKELGIKPQAQWIGGALGGVDPSIMGIGPIESTKKLLKKLDMTMDDIDLVEGNEAFAAQSIVVQRELHIPSEKLNVNGGAIALGHPVGASGCRILVTLVHALKKRNARNGLAMLCIGGGMGCTTIIRNCEENFYNER